MSKTLEHAHSCFLTHTVLRDVPEAPSYYTHLNEDDPQTGNPSIWGPCHFFWRQKFKDGVFNRIPWVFRLINNYRNPWNSSLDCCISWRKVMIQVLHLCKYSLIIIMFLESPPRDEWIGFGGIQTIMYPQKKGDKSARCINIKSWGVIGSMVPRPRC